MTRHVEWAREPGRDPGDESPAAWVLTRSKLEDLVARPLTDEVVARVAKAIPNSSIPDTLQVIVQAVTDDIAEVTDEDREAQAAYDDQWGPSPEPWWENR